ncbi:MAG: AmmeMemoRadiSam system radical SAM enzyme [Polyangiaceae bacterium]|nr:AmmeMemoRadiSam system radical SAM enzyme [Polyangiaceae bacterium]
MAARVNTRLDPGAGRWQHALADGRIQCDLCPRACRLRDGQRAFCFVRQRRGPSIELGAYGRATGFCVDPIEKKPLYHFFPGSSVLSFGTAGCNLGCRFCQNWDMSKARSVELMSELATPEQIADAAVRGGCKSVAFTYNDPVVFAEFAIDTAQACRERGVQSVAVTAGYITPEARPDFFRHMDAANVDLKAFTPTFYRDYCGAELEPVKDTLVYLARETGVWLEVTTLLIPGCNDSPEEIDRLCDWYVGALGPEVPLHFTAFHPDFRMTHLERTPLGTCLRARQQALGHGLKHVYSGNVYAPESQATYCSGCGQAVIERDGYLLGSYRLEKGLCAVCATPLSGRFGDERPSDPWGPRRARVRV